jgi:hypothetical protein
VVIHLPSKREESIKNEQEVDIPEEADIISISLEASQLPLESKKTTKQEQPTSLPEEKSPKPVETAHEPGLVPPVVSHLRSSSESLLKMNRRPPKSRRIHQR